MNLVGWWQSKGAFERHDRRVLGLFLGLFVVLNILSWTTPFFWDGILFGRILRSFEDAGLQGLIVPESLDAGHPPFFPLYLWGWAKVAGWHLSSVHLAMLPILIGICWQFFRFVRRVLPGHWQWWGMSVLFFEPCFLTQSTLLTADLVLVFGFLLGLGGIFSGKRWQLGAGAMMMVMVNFRGIFLVGLLLLVDVVVHALWREMRAGNFNFLRWLLAYLPAGLFAIAWYLYHWNAQGWLFSPPPETYGGHRELLGPGGWARNGAILGWRWADNGRVFLWLLALGGGLALGWRTVWRLPEVRALRIPALILFGGLGLILLPFSNPIGHRYFMVGYLLLGLLALVVLARFRKPALRWGLGLLVALGLASGHFWVYGGGLANGWDAMLSHRSFFKVQEAVLNHIGLGGIDPQNVCGDFPYLDDLRVSRMQTPSSVAVSFYKGGDYAMALDSTRSRAYFPGIMDTPEGRMPIPKTALGDGISGEVTCEYYFWSNVSNYPFPTDTVGNDQIVFEVHHGQVSGYLYSFAPFIFFQF